MLYLIFIIFFAFNNIEVYQKNIEQKYRGGRGECDNFIKIEKCTLFPDLCKN